MTPTPSPRQGEALFAIKNHRDSWGFAPSLRELCVALGINSTNSVNDLLRALELKGHIKRYKQVARSTVITMRGMRWLNAMAERAP